MSELAFNINGERFDVPASASFWRVRRFKASGRGTPEVVFGDDGLPLIISIDTEISEFRALVRNLPGRYRLDPVDENHRACEDGTGAYLQLNDDLAAREEPGRRRSEGDELLREIVRANAEMVKTIAEKFATVMDSAATLLRAADGAGMPAREPSVLPVQLAGAWRNAEHGSAADVDTEQTDEEPDDPRDETLLARLGRVAEGAAPQLIPLLTHQLYTKVMGLSQEQAMAMMGATVPAPAPAPAAKPAAARPNPSSAAGRSRPVSPVAPPPPPASAAAEARPSAPTGLDANFFLQLAAIEALLTPEEAKLARTAVGAMPPPALAAWRERIVQMNPEQAAELIRAECRRIAAKPPSGPEPGVVPRETKEAA